jgi:hypothetical protein
LVSPAGHHLPRTRATSPVFHPLNLIKVLEDTQASLVNSNSNSSNNNNNNHKDPSMVDWAILEPIKAQDKPTKDKDTPVMVQASATTILNRMAEAGEATTLTSGNSELLLLLFINCMVHGKLSMIYSTQQSATVPPYLIVIVGVISIFLFAALCFHLSSFILY